MVVLEREYNAAFLRHDIQWIADVLADDYIVTYGDGSVGGKETDLKSLREPDETITASSLDDFTVHDYGNFVVVNFRVTAKGTRKGKPLNAQFRYTDVFTQRDGKWKAVASHNTHIGEPNF